MKPRLDIFGPYPPPIGGISIHLQRMEFFLKQAGIYYTIINHGSARTPDVTPTHKSALWYLSYLVSPKKGQLIHFHQFFKFHYFYYYIFRLCTRRRVIVTIHEENLLFYPKWQQQIILAMLRYTRFVKLISVSQKLHEFLTDNQVESQWLPAYVPAMEIDFKRVEAANGKPYFIYSVWKLDRKISTTIYNVDLAFQLAQRLKNEFNMLFLIGTERESDKTYLLELLRKYGVEQNVTVVYEGQLTDYMKNGKFLLRTNAIDGFGVSLQEAIDQDVPAVASDVCVRPQGTILFKNGDFDDLLEKVSNLQAHWQTLEKSSPRYHEVLLELYKQNLVN